MLLISLDANLDILGIKVSLLYYKYAQQLSSTVRACAGKCMQTFFFFKFPCIYVLCVLLKLQCDRAKQNKGVLTRATEHCRVGLCDDNDP